MMHKNVRQVLPIKVEGNNKSDDALTLMMPHTTGNLTVNEDSFKLQAKGARPDEALDLSLKLPLLNPELTKANRAVQAGQGHEAGSGILKFNLADFLPKPVLDTDGSEAQDESGLEGGGGHFSLRCGQMLVSAEVPFPLPSLTPPPCFSLDHGTKTHASDVACTP